MSALALFIAGILVDLVGLALAAVFAGRGIAGYLPVWRRAHPLKPFARSS